MAAPSSAFPPVDRAAWEARAAEELGGAEALADLARSTPEGLVKPPLYTAEDDPSGGALVRWGSWLPLTLIEEGELDRAAELAREDRANGAVGVSIPAAGMPLLEKLGLECAVRLEPHASAEPIALRSLSVWDRPAFGGYDPLAALARDGGVPGGLAAALARAETWVDDDVEAPLGIDVSVFHRAGAYAVQELAYAISGVAEFVRSSPLSALDVSVNTSLGFAVGRDLFLEVAKLRAARVLWAKLFAACGDKQPVSPWIHATTSWRTLTSQDPLTNLLRATTQVFAAALGGADAITCRPFDAALGLPSDQGRRLARNTQTILSEEAHVGRVADPAGGSHYVEQLTDQLARAAWEHFRELERAGGMAACLLDGTVRAQVDASWAEWRARYAVGGAQVLGVSLHPPQDSESLRRAARPVPRLRATEIEPFPDRRDAQVAS